MRNFSPIHLFTIYARVLPNRDICSLKIVSNNGLEIKFPNLICSLEERTIKILYCKCGSMINLDISYLQCPRCLNRSLPSIVKEENETYEFWQKLKETFGQNKGQ